MLNSDYENSLSDEKRGENGVHYTDIDNILKVINPLFLEDLQNEFERIKNDGNKLIKFQDKISKLKFLDPAMGCGNFLCVIYIYLAELECKIIQRFTELGISFNFKVNVGQFYGIEIDNGACEQAIESMKDMHERVNNYYKEIFNQDVYNERLFIMPKIINANALEIDWETVISKKKLSYIVGNPPFVGYHLKTQSQKQDMEQVFGKKVKHGQLDYVCAWFKKAAEFMEGTKIETAFVSTNSITQGQQPTILWKELFKHGAEINFAYRSFKW